MAYKIEIDQEKCIGCGACAAQCDNFEVKDNKAVAKKSELKEIGCNQEAADICPVNVISIYKK
jgi:ferredoxin